MRSSGVLLPVFSLPDGKIGKEAYRFVDFLQAAGQRWWQVLPVHPPGPGGSPYSALSAFAGEGALAGTDATDPPPAAYRRKQAYWLKDYARFRAARERHGSPWTEWPEDLGDLDTTRHEARQHAFDGAWLELKAYANERGVGLIGDVPLFVAHDSADVWAHRDLFRLNDNGHPAVVTGVPPDYFSRRGQRWGHPHYDWDAHAGEHFNWWKQRMKRAFELFDMVRIDHFLGIVRAWEIPGRAKTGRKGHWAEGPGAALLRSFPKGELFAEDLGLQNPKADELREEFGLPGMRVLQFSFGPDEATRPHLYPRRSVIYTGTHDNDTTVGWYRKAGADANRARRYAGCKARDIAWGLIRVAMLSVADTVVVPAQDLLGLGSSARINRPGTTKGNWSWKLRRGQLTRAIARRLRELTEDAGR
ncbi:MAG: 4-alpha-glucanotransferase [Planctomycetota bacterium]|jgi:4-alpha-glucanotransferase